MAMAETVTQSNAQIVTTDITNFFTYRGFSDPLITPTTQEYQVNDTVSIACIFTSEEETLEDSEHLLIYPNPNNGYFNVSIKSKASEKVNINLYNAIGQTVLTKEINLVLGENNIEIESSNLISGFYFLKIDASKFSETKKIIIQR